MSEEHAIFLAVVTLYVHGHGEIPECIVKANEMLTAVRKNNSLEVGL